MEKGRASKGRGSGAVGSRQDAAPQDDVVSQARSLKIAEFLSSVSRQGGCCGDRRREIPGGSKAQSSKFATCWRPPVSMQRNGAWRLRLQYV